MPVRQCAGCRTRAPQAGLARFVHTGEAWEFDAARTRSPGRGTYLCSPGCAERLRKHKRFAGLALAAESARWSCVTLSAGEPGVYDRRVPPARPGAIRSNVHEVE